MAAVKAKAVTVKGFLGGLATTMMLDSGSSVSLIRQNVLAQTKSFVNVRPIPQLRLVTASGEQLAVKDFVSAQVQLDKSEWKHDFLVVDQLVAPVIVGVDFLQKNGLVLDFSSSPVKICSNSTSSSQMPNKTVTSVYHPQYQPAAQVSIITANCSQTANTMDDCAVPSFGEAVRLELPQSPNPKLAVTIRKFKHLFRTSPGATSVAYHYIPTVGSPVRVPPRRIPAHYRAQVQKMIEKMLEEGIIEESSSPWMAPAVFVPKKSGEPRMCIDYRELNKKTYKDAYPLPLADEVQDRLAGSTIFSTLDLRSGYWQMPVHDSDQHKTAFCPGPGLGLFEFKRMPFGLTGAPSSFQRMMDKIFRDLPFVSNYIDDLLIHSTDEISHKQHLEEVFHRLQEVGLTLRGEKCRIGLSQVTYLGHVFSASGMTPDEEKVKAVQSWPIPNSVTAVRCFLGLASYYRRYINRFADVAAPLHNLTQTGTPFQWSPECQRAFQSLKELLTSAPVLAYPRFCANTSPFVLNTDASEHGVGAVLEQGGRVVAFASRTLTKAEKNYSVIQKECLAVVYATKQYRHYLLGRPFKLYTDHAPLQWLSAQKMEGMLARWALALQEFDFKIEYKPGSQNGNADALSRRDSPYTESSPCAATFLRPDLTQNELHVAQQTDPVIAQLYQHLSTAKPPSTSTNNQTVVNRYCQFWPQLKLINGIVCRCYRPHPADAIVTVPVLPPSLRHQAIFQAHNAPSAGHLGKEKTLHRLRQEAYWVNMAKDVEQHCRECIKCQKTKPTLPQKAPLINVPIGRPWQMIAVDILEVPVSCHNNRYLLVIQDYFTKWPEVIPLPDQKASRITSEMIKFFSAFGLPDVLHSDQGRNFESAILRQTLDAFGITKSHTSAYHPQGDGMVERFNRSLLQMLRAFVDKNADWERYLPLMLYAYRTAVHSSTGVTPFQLMFGRSPATSSSSPTTAFDPESYSAHLQAKLMEMHDFVQKQTTTAARRQKQQYDVHAQERNFHVGDPVWLSIPTAGKLDPRWEGKWIIRAVKSPVNMEISDGQRTKVVHINRIRHRVLPQQLDSNMSGNDSVTWHPPQIDHVIPPPTSSPTPQRRYPQRDRHPPDRYTA